MLPQPIRRFVDIFSQLPSIGPRQATRLAFHLLGLGQGNLSDLAEVITGLGRLKICPNCFYTHENNDRFCHICANPLRQKNIIMVTEKETDLMSLEKTGKYHGRYLIIGDLKKGLELEPAQKLRLNSLKQMIKNELDGKASEIILAINPTTFGDMAATMLANELKEYALKISRLGRGIPTGGEIEFADEQPLASALENRTI